MRHRQQLDFSSFHLQEMKSDSNVSTLKVASVTVRIASNIVLQVVP